MPVPLLGVEELVRLALVLVLMVGVAVLGLLARRHRRDRRFDEALRRLLEEERTAA